MFAARQLLRSDSGVCGPQATGKPEEALTTLVLQVESGRVQSAEVILHSHIHHERSESDARRRCKIAIQEFSRSGEAALLLSALQRTTLRASAGPADLKWGGVFRLVGGGVREVYLDGFGILGQIDSLPASFQGGLYEWLRQLTACLK